MELKVWVGGIQRIVCGVTAETTCQDVIMALAHATGQTGRFVLLEQFNDQEKYLLPDDKPLEILEKWGEYANGVRFLLRKSSDKNMRSPGSGSSTASPRSSRRSMRAMMEFSARLVESGGTEDLLKFIALQRERQQLLKEEITLLESEIKKLGESELDDLKKKEKLLNEQVQELSEYDFDDEEIEANCNKIHATLVTELSGRKEELAQLEVKIAGENSKLESLTQEFAKAKDELTKTEIMEKEKTEELRKLRQEVENSHNSLQSTEEKLSEVLSDLGKCIDQVRLREGVLQDLKLVLKSSS